MSEVTISSGFSPFISLTHMINTDQVFAFFFFPNRLKKKKKHTQVLLSKLQHKWKQLP